MKTGLCLAGGGVKGAAHIGAIKAFEEKNIKFDYIAGTSSGSIVAALYASGFTAEEMLKIFKKYCKKIKYVDFINIVKLIFGLIFTRKIKKNKRPIPKSNNYLLSPCDSKLTYLKIDKNTTFNIKNSTYTINSILKNHSLAKKYRDGAALIFRLSPDDYHRYMFICDGVITSNYEIKGTFHSVNPVAYKNYEVFKENTRECTSIKTNDMGLVTYVEVGALLVGKIENKVKSGMVKKGLEKGYFKYGGSTIVLLFEKNKIALDEEIINNSLNGLETYVKYGEKIGEKKK